jgi:hypothetical protein
VDAIAAIGACELDGCVWVMGIRELRWLSLEMLCAGRAPFRRLFWAAYSLHSNAMATSQEQNIFGDVSTSTLVKGRKLGKGVKVSIYVTPEEHSHSNYLVKGMKYQGFVI